MATTKNIKLTGRTAHQVAAIEAYLPEATTGKTTITFDTDDATKALEQVFEAISRAEKAGAHKGVTQALHSVKRAVQTVIEGELVADLESGKVKLTAGLTPEAADELAADLAAERAAIEEADAAINAELAAEAVTTITIPPTFYDDHVSRDLPAGTVVKRTKKAVTVTLTVAEFNELLSDALHYADADSGIEDKALVRAAKAIMPKLEAAPWPSIAFAGLDKPAAKAPKADPKPAAAGERGPRGEHLDRHGLVVKGNRTVKLAFAEFELTQKPDTAGWTTHCRLHDQFSETFAMKADAEKAGSRKARPGWCSGCEADAAAKAVAAK